jgi:nucleoside 2-deoxyribosyltransferase
VKTVYLAGPIAGCTDDETHGWRTEVKRRLKDKFNFLDPAARWDTRDRLLDPAEVIRLVETDIEEIRQSDIVLANVWKISAGTSMEFVYAKRVYYKTVISINPNSYLSPWVDYHSDWVVSTIDRAIGRLRRIAGEPWNG